MRGWRRIWIRTESRATRSTRLASLVSEPSAFSETEMSRAYQFRVRRAERSTYLSDSNLYRLWRNGKVNPLVGLGPTLLTAGFEDAPRTEYERETLVRISGSSAARMALTALSRASRLLYDRPAPDALFRTKQMHRSADQLLSGTLAVRQRQPAAAGKQLNQPRRQRQPTRRLA